MNSEKSDKLVVVDGANVAYIEQTETDQPRISNLRAVHRALATRGYHPIVIIDASLIHDIVEGEVEFYRSQLRSS
jgi:hypothetical protein